MPNVWSILKSTVYILGFGLGKKAFKKVKTETVPQKSKQHHRKVNSTTAQTAPQNRKPKAQHHRKKWPKTNSTTSCGAVGYYEYAIR